MVSFKWSQVQVTVPSRSKSEVQESVSTSVNPKPLYSLALLLPLTQSSQVAFGDWCRLAFLSTNSVMCRLRCKWQSTCRSHFGVQVSVSASVIPKPLNIWADTLTLTQSSQVGNSDWCWLAFLSTESGICRLGCKWQSNCRFGLSL